MKIILVRGWAGITYYGPFADNATAMTWAANNLEHTNWWTESIASATKAST